MLAKLLLIQVMLYSQVNLRKDLKEIEKDFFSRLTCWPKHGFEHIKMYINIQRGTLKKGGFELTTE